MTFAIYSHTLISVTRVPSEVNMQALPGSPTEHSHLPQPLDEIEPRLAAWVRSQAPLRRALARIAGRLVAKRAWERLGFARLEDYARERTGLSARQLYDLAHVDAALSRLPRVDAAFHHGTLPWSKVRLLCRVAVACDEARWVAFARVVSVRALEREVRAVDRGCIEAGVLAPECGEDGSLLSPRKTVQIQCTPAVHGKWWRARWFAQRVAGDKLPPWACMEAVVGEVLSALPLEGDPLADETANVCADHASAREASDAHPPRAEPRTTDVCNTHAPEPDLSSPPELPVFLRHLLEAIDDADAFALDARLRRAATLEQRAWAEAGRLLAAVASERLYVDVDSGTHTLDSYARERLGISPRKARALLRLERASALCPELRSAYRDGRLSWVQAQALVPLVLLDHSGPHRAAWIDHATRVSVRRLEDDVEYALAHDTVAPPDERQLCAKPTRSGASTSAGSQQAETERFFFLAPRDVALLIHAAICTVRRHLERRTGRLPTPGEAMDAMFEHAFEAWSAHAPHVPREHRVFERDGWRCTAPGCSSYRNLHDHHVVFRSAGGSDALSNRTTLCAWHHLRGVHAGVIRCAGEAPDGLEFELGLRSDGPPLLRYDAGDVLVSRRSRPCAIQRA